MRMKRLLDVSIMQRGSCVTQNTIAAGNIPVISGGQTPAYYCDKANRNADVITIAGSGAYAGFVQYWNEPIFVCDAFSVQGINGVTNTKYLYYVLQGMQNKIFATKKGSGVPHVHISCIENFEIPIPSIEEQEEIVRILDKFTELEAELEAELEKEMEARKKQYEWYRDRLLSFDEGVPMVKLENIATDIYRGAGIKKDEVASDGIPCVRYGEIYTSYDISFTECISHTQENIVSAPKYFEHGDILFAITGESIEEIGKSIAYLGREKCMAGGDIVVMKHNQESRYISYALSTTAAQMQKSKGKVKSKVVHSSVPALKEIEIPLPDIATQKRIADLLDSFHALCNDITTGLPAEIAARRKQYEYYRDKLLSFEEVA